MAIQVSTAKQALFDDSTMEEIGRRHWCITGRHLDFLILAAGASDQFNARCDLSLGRPVVSTLRRSDPGLPSFLAGVNAGVILCPWESADCDMVRDHCSNTLD